jgi:hypothetical protein
MKVEEYIILSCNEARNTYVFKQTLATLSNGVIRFNKVNKIIELLNYKLRFMSYEYFEKYGQYGSRAKIIYAERFEKALDDFKEKKQ